MIRRYGSSSDPYDTTTNTEIIQAGGTNYPFMIADINDGEPANVQYIHWLSDTSSEFYVSEILCYAEKRLYDSDFTTVKDYLLPQNSPISLTNCVEESYDP